MSKHTPAPWKVKEWEHLDVDGSILTCGSHVVANHGGQDIAISACTVEDEDESHLHLIAAAPELLAAVEAVIEWFDMEADHQIEPDFMARVRACGKAEDMARAAIAKAKGGAA